MVAFVITFGSIYFLAKNIKDLEGLVASWGIFGPLLVVLLYGALSVTPIPTDPLSAISGALFGPIVGFIVSWIGNTFAAVIEYFLGLGIRNATAFEKRKKNLPWGLDKAPVNSACFLIGGRFVPGFGSKIVSVLAGVYGVGLWRYTWTAAVANIFGSAFYTLGGFQLVTLFSRI